MVENHEKCHENHERCHENREKYRENHERCHENLENHEKYREKYRENHENHEKCHEKNLEIIYKRDMYYLMFSILRQLCEREKKEETVPLISRSPPPNGL